MTGIIFQYVAWFLFILIAVVWMLLLMSQVRTFSGPYHRLKKHPPVSVIIPAYNESETIAKTIESVLDLNYPKKLLEVIVVDDGSSDTTSIVASRYEKEGKIKLITNEKNMGKAASMNRAVSAAKGEFIACMDADSIVERDILKKLLPYFGDKKMASVSPALQVWRKRNLLEKAQHAEYILNLFLRKMLAIIDSVFVTPGVFTIYRKDALIAVGGFENGNITEDMEIAFRLQDHDYKLEADVNASSYTLCPSSLKELLQQRLRWYRGGIQNMIKYKHMFFSRTYGYLGGLVLPLNFASALIVSIIFLNLIWENLYHSANFLWNLYLINFDISTIFSQFDFWNEFSLNASNIITTPLILGIMAVAMSSGLLYISFRTSNHSIRENKLGYIGFLILLPTLLMGIWALAFITEVIGVKRKW